MKKGVEKLICIPTQHYDVPSGRIGNPYVGIILVELDGIRDRQWNTGRVIVFKTFILQGVSGVSRSRNRRDRIDS